MGSILKQHKHKSEDENIFFTSDTHFFHKNIMNFQNNRQGRDYLEMGELLIKNWNEQVMPDDIVYHLGDVSFGSSEQTLSVIKRLNGVKRLISGNHDRKRFLEMSGLFDSVDDYLKISVDKRNIILFHYPIFEWDEMSHGSYHLYGHVHNKPLPRIPEGRSMDVGIDTREDMKLYTWSDIYRILEKKPIRSRYEGRC